jgi:hypothetical protein
MIFCENPGLITIIVNKNRSEVTEQEMADIRTEMGLREFRFREEWLEEGTFMWEIDGKLIDFTVHRFNFDVPM